MKSQSKLKSESTNIDPNVQKQMEIFKEAFPPESGGGEARIYATLGGLVGMGFDDSGEPTGGRFVEEETSGYISIQEDTIADDGTWCWDISIHSEDHNIGESYGKKGFKSYEEVMNSSLIYSANEFMTSS